MTATVFPSHGGDLPSLDPGLLAALREVVGADGISVDPGALLVYESDGLTTHRARPRAVVFPRGTSEVAAVVRLLARAGVPFVARGAGTGLSGGAVALEGAVVISLARMDRILELDPANRRAVVEAGVVNAALSRATSSYGLYYAPDPSSQTACTIGGNVAENAGGPHCLKYGVTSNHVTGLVVVLPTGEVVRLGGGAGEGVGYDLVGLFVGSEGTFGIATEVEVRLLPLPEGVETLLALFDDVADASEAVSSIIAAGLLPAALELIDRETIRVVEASIFAAGLPTDLGAALVIEFDGARSGLAADAERARSLCLEAGAREVRRARDAAERERLWQARKKSFGAFGRIAPDLMVQDAVVPRSRLTEVVKATYEIAARHELRICNVFHAGDGNLHPTILFDRRDPDQVRRVEAASREIMLRCVEAGGTITGEHGVGLDKREYMGLVHDDVALRVMRDLQRIFDPAGLANPGKVFEPEGGDARDADSVGVRGVGEDTVGEGGGSAGVTSGGRARSIPTELSKEVVDYNPADLVISVGAGITLGELQGILAREGQWLPLDPPGWEGMTLGEAILEGGAGPLRQGYGTPRDQVLGLRLVTGAGEVVECGGRVMKNVAGYDLVKLVVGSRGTLGVVTRAELRLRALPERDATQLFAAHSPAPLLDLARRLGPAGLEPVALELLSPAAWRGVAPGAPRGEWDGRWVLLARWHGNRGVVEEAGRGARAVAEGVGGVEEWPGEWEGGAAVWTALSRLEGNAEVVIRLADRPSALTETLASARSLPGAADLPVIAHLGAGIVRVLAPLAEPDEEWLGALEWIGARLAARRGSLIVRGRGGESVDTRPHGRDSRGTPVAVPKRSGTPAGWPRPVADIDPAVSRLERAIRERFDPAGLLARGRYTG